MAKKVLTPEQAEIKAMKKARSSERRNAFVAVLLAVAIGFAALSMGKSFSENKNAGEGEAYITDDTSSQQNAPNNQDDEFAEGEQVLAPLEQQETVSKDEISDDPSQWTKEQIVYMYKQAATKSHDTAESSQTMTMPTMVVNDGDGALGFFINMVKPVIDSVIEKQATTYGGITGGYQKLVPSDVESAKAYKDGKYTVIEMRMVEQTDGLYGDPQEGTVGHAINVLGNVATAVEQFPDFDIKYEEADIKIHYADPIVKVRINENGIIEKGTWSYMSEIDIKHLAIGSVMVDKAYAEIEYVIVVGGGF